MTLRVPHGPAGWQMCMGLYAGCTAVSLLASPNAFQKNPVWQVLAEWGFPQRGWAVVLLGYALASVVCLLRNIEYKLATLAFVGIFLWMFIGFEMLMGGARAGFLSSAGLFELLSGLGCAACLVQWARTGA